MTVPESDNRQSVFGCWSFDPDTGDLHDGATTTRLEPQVAKLLGFFLADQNRVISRDELIAAVWDNRIVSDDAINRCISILRQTLTPDDKNAYIETLVRRGYIAHFPPAPTADISAAGTRDRKVPLSEARAMERRRTDRRRAPPGRVRNLLLVLAAVVMIGAAVLYARFGHVSDSTRFGRQSATQRPPVVAVLPFASADLSGDSAFFANGVHDDLLTQLSKLQSVRVISSTSVREYRDVARNLRSIGAELGADAILEGRVQIAENQIRINAQLIDVQRDEHLWAESYDRELTTSNIFEVQGEIARAITLAMNAVLTQQDNAQLALIPTANMAAYRAYHRAMQIRDSRNITLGDPEYREALQEAVNLDPNFSRAWAELVSILAFLNFGGTHPEMTVRAEQALQQLGAIAPGSPEHFIGQASYFYYALKDYRRALDLINRALAMNPGDVRALELRSWIERRLGDFDASLVSKLQALALDPRNPARSDALLGGLLVLHRYDEARTELERHPQKSYPAAATQVLLQFREHRDFSRMQAEMDDVCRAHVEPNCGWESRVANRQYPQALETLRELGDDSPASAFAESSEHRLLTHWLMGEIVDATRYPPQWQHDPLNHDTHGSIDLLDVPRAAMLEGIQGHAEEAERLIEAFFRPAMLDWALRSMGRHVACRVLGMLGATQATVLCLRDGVTEPSLVIPFFEPYLPFYDRVRATPEFSQMLDEIDPDAPAGMRAR